MIDNQYSKLLEEVRTVFKNGRTLSLKYRKMQLRACLKMIEENIDEMCEALKKDLNKPRQELVVLELEVTKNEILYLIENFDELTSPDFPNSIQVPFLFDEAKMFRDPYGLVLIMGAWNYPIQLCLMPLIGAIAAGNCVVLKPSELVPTSSNLLAKLIPQYLDSEAYIVVEGGIPETTELLKHRFDYIFYTGSTAVGRIVREASNKFLTPVTLELGGKSPVYLDDSANMEEAVKRIIWGKLVNAGQTCIAPDYLLCTSEMRDKFIEKAKGVIESFYGNDPQKCEDYCRIVTQRHTTRLSEILECGKVAVGGSVDVQDRYVQPSILIDVPHDSKAFTEEIFGPILVIETVKSVEDVIAFITEREKPLAFYVFSTRKNVIKDLMERVSFGGGCINDTLFQMGDHDLPFGGVGESGMGSYHGKQSFYEFSHIKSVLHRHDNFLSIKLGSNRYPPYTDSKIKELLRLMQHRTIPSMRFLPHLVAFGLGIASVYVGQAISEAVN